MIKNRHYILFLFIPFILNSCIKNNLPYPYVEGKIIEMVFDGQLGTPIISNENRSVVITVNDSVDVTKLRMKRMITTDDTNIYTDDDACEDGSRFPTNSFASLSHIPLSANTTFNTTKPFRFLLKTYQEYIWTVTVLQEMKREIAVQNQVGEPTIDEYTHSINVYVGADQPLNNITVTKLKLGVVGARITPSMDEIHDFTYPKVFTVYNFDQEPQEWTISVLQSTMIVAAKSVSAWATKAYLEGEMQTGTMNSPTFKYRKVSESTFQTVDLNDIQVSGGTFKAEIQGLTPGTDYLFKACLGNNESEEMPFQTESATQLPNMSFDDWSQVVKNGKQSWYPCLDQTTANYWWDTGNVGSNSLSEKNPTSPETSDVVKGKACRMASTSVLSYFAAGSIYTGYFDKVVLPGAQLYFGRPYTSRPTALKGFYKYNAGTVDMVKDPYSGHKGKPDSCYIYAALFNWEAPFRVNTVEDRFVSLSPTNQSLIAAGTLTTTASHSKYDQFKIPLTYFKKTIKPTHILIVATSSKYGDYFTGSTSSVLLIDEFELEFE